MKQWDRSTLQNVSIANTSIPGLVSCWQKICNHQEKEYLGFGCVRQPGLCRTWNIFPQVLWVSKELKNYFDRNLHWEKDKLNWKFPSSYHQILLWHFWREFLTGSKKGSKKGQCRVKDLGYCFCLLKLHALILLSNGNKFLSMFFCKSNPPLLSLSSAASRST